jgi:hypothetical protein
VVFFAETARLSLGAAIVATTMLVGSAPDALSQTCKPQHLRPVVVLKTMGVCAFDPTSMSYSGDATEQATCLMRGMDPTRNLSPPMAVLPPAFANRVGRDTGLPSREVLSTFLSAQNLEDDFAAYLWQPVSRADNNNPDYPTARYLVLHDTSGPNYGHRPFPDDVDTTAHLNNLKSFICTDGWGKAHVVINRAGELLLSHDFAVPWRETKFERAQNFDGALKGLFLHVEMVQPRRSAHGHDDAQPPDPAFTTAQYDRLALIYVIASVRAERWLIPAFHAAIDAGIPNGHDDPMGFEVDSFANSLEIFLQRLGGPQEVRDTTP